MSDFMSKRREDNDKMSALAWKLTDEILESILISTQPSFRGKVYEVIRGLLDVKRITLNG
jgi:hypothetical protein